MTRKTIEPRAHPAPYSEEVLEVIYEVVRDEQFQRVKPESFTYPALRLLDSFAGIGKIHDLAEWAGIRTVGVELEPEWAAWNKATEVGDATRLRFRASSFDIYCTSPCYGNRMGDNYEAKDGSERRNYRFYLGRPLSENSSAGMLWWDDHRGDPYRGLHAQAWMEAIRVLRKNGLFILNISNHYRTLEKGKPPVEQMVSEWHMKYLLEIGLKLEEVRKVHTKRYKKGENRDNRTKNELVIVMRKAE